MVIIDFANWAEWDRQRTQFMVGEDNFADLQILTTGDASGFHYFKDSSSNQLVKEFVLERRPRTLTYCVVTLIGRDDKFEPRLFLKKDALTNKRWEEAQEQIENVEEHLLVKAAVNLDKAHENFWRLVSFLTSFKEIAVPGKPMVIVEEEATGLVSLLEKGGKAKVLEVVKAAVGGELTETDVRLLVDRKAALEEFERLIHEDGYIACVITDTSARGEEDVWQKFFEKHPWIFGYGLKLIAAEGLGNKLEQVTRASNAFNHGGDRVDGLMATKGLIQSLMFVEIKKASTDLLPRAHYRTGAYPPSSELSGAVAQVQATTHQAIEQLGRGPLHRPIGEDGFEQDVVGTVRPRQVVVIGTLDQLRADGSINIHRFRSFELYRRSLVDVEVITFDELLARARFIARHDETAKPASDVASSNPASTVERNDDHMPWEQPWDESPPPSDDDVPF